MSTAPLHETLDDAIVALRVFKDELDSLDDERRDAAFALAWPEYPCFETLINEMSDWANRLSSAQTEPQEPKTKEEAP